MARKKLGHERNFCDEDVTWLVFVVFFAVFVAVMPDNTQE
jgi:hypothetical protein